MATDRICLDLVRWDVIERTVTQAKRQLSALVEAALNGQEVILSRAGRPVVKIIPLGAKPQSREPGGLTRLILPDDFDHTGYEIIASFEGNSA